MGQEFHTKLVGVTRDNANGSNRQGYIRAFCKAGMTVHLVREPDNTHDPDAVGAWITCRQLWGLIKGDRQIGYLSGDVAREIAPMLDKGRQVIAVVTAVTGGTAGQSLGVNVHIDKGLK